MQSAVPIAISRSDCDTPRHEAFEIVVRPSDNLTEDRWDKLIQFLLEVEPKQ